MSGGIQARGLASAYARGRRHIEELNRLAEISAANRAAVCANCHKHPPRKLAAAPAAQGSAPIRWCEVCANAWALVHQDPAAIAEQRKHASLEILQRALRIEVRENYRPEVVELLQDQIHAVNRERNRLLAKKGWR